MGTEFVFFYKINIKNGILKKLLILNNNYLRLHFRLIMFEVVSLVTLSNR